jgi:hypothetical protein
MKIKGDSRKELLRIGTQEDRFRILAKEVIESALIDVKQKRDDLLRIETLRWFKAKETHPFGYGWCLDVSGYNGRAIADYLRTINASA